MIRVSFTVLVLIYVSLLLASVLGAWLFYGWRRLRREREAFRHVLRCLRCGFEFKEQSEQVTVACPRCSAVSERLPLSRL